MKSPEPPLEQPSGGPTPWGLVTVAVSLGFLVGGILWPGIAESLLRILVVSLALGWTAARALAAGLPSAAVHSTYAPFDATLAESLVPAAPDVVRRRALELTSVDDPEEGPRRPIPWPVARTLIHEAARRLENGHGLRLDSPGDGARIRMLVSDATAALLGLEERPEARSVDEARMRMVPLARIDDVLDDLESL